MTSESDDEYYIYFVLCGDIATILSSNKYFDVSTPNTIFTSTMDFCTWKGSKRFAIVSLVDGLFYKTSGDSYRSTGLVGTIGLGFLEVSIYIRVNYFYSALMVRRRDHTL